SLIVSSLSIAGFHVICIQSVICSHMILFFFFFFFNDTANTEIYTLSLHDALPIWIDVHRAVREKERLLRQHQHVDAADVPPARLDRKSTRLNSSHGSISYAVFCLKKKNRRISRQAWSG